MKTKFAIGCLVQWYEIEIVGEYIDSLIQALGEVENKQDIIVDFTLVTNQDLEKVNDEITLKEIETVKKVLFKKLTNIYQLRIEYPE